jgi:hypothetical protein
MIRVLRSPFSRLVDRGLMLVTVSGRHSGRPYTLPVQYVQDGRTLWVYAGGAGKTWWRNLIGGADIFVLLRRRTYVGWATAHTADTGRDIVQEGLRRYVDRFPRLAQRLSITPDRRDRAISDTVMVRISLDDGTGSQLTAAVPQRSQGRARSGGRDNGD